MIENMRLKEWNTECGASKDEKKTKIKTKNKKTHERKRENKNCTITKFSN